MHIMCHKKYVPPKADSRRPIYLNAPPKACSLRGVRSADDYKSLRNLTSQNICSRFRYSGCATTCAAQSHHLGSRCRSIRTFSLHIRLSPRIVVVIVCCIAKTHNGCPNVGGADRRLAGPGSRRGTRRNRAIASWHNTSIKRAIWLPTRGRRTKTRYMCGVFRIFCELITIIILYICTNLVLYAKSLRDMDIGLPTT